MYADMCITMYSFTVIKDFSTYDATQRTSPFTSALPAVIDRTSQVNQNGRENGIHYRYSFADHRGR